MDYAAGMIRREKKYLQICRLNLTLYVLSEISRIYADEKYWVIIQLQIQNWHGWCLGVIFPKSNATNSKFQDGNRFFQDGRLVKNRKTIKCAKGLYFS